VTLFLEYVNIIERHYGKAVAEQFIKAYAAIVIADDSDDDSAAYTTRVDEITALLDVINKADGVPQHKLTIDRISPKSIRVILTGPHGLVWRCYVFQEDFMFCFAQTLANILPSK